jgi:hypothetical protein
VSCAKRGKSGKSSWRVSHKKEIVMIPTIDASRVSGDDSFQKLDKNFGLSARLKNYNEHASKGDMKNAVKILEITRGVLDGHEFKREIIRDKGLEKAAGAVLAAIDYALLTIKGEQPAIPFNEFSTDESIVLSP